MRSEIMSESRADERPVDRVAQLRAWVRRLLKRVFDLSLTIILLIIVLPLACFIVLVLTMSGQVPFYPHVRIGRYGHEFGCLKFRTMHRDANLALADLLQRDYSAKLEWESDQKLRHDPRVTRIGGMLRATSLDELPQLINVLIGDMSLVGPRPVTKDELAKFYGPFEAAAYSSVRPGITGLWQISGRSDAGYAKRVALDTFYAQRLSLRSDLVILFKTVDVVVRQRGAR